MSSSKKAGAKKGASKKATSKKSASKTAAKKGSAKRAARRAPEPPAASVGPIVGLVPSPPEAEKLPKLDLDCEHKVTEDERNAVYGYIIEASAHREDPADIARSIKGIFRLDVSRNYVAQVRRRKAAEIELRTRHVFAAHNFYGRLDVAMMIQLAITEAYTDNNINRVIELFPHYFQLLDQAQPESLNERQICHGMIRQWIVLAENAGGKDITPLIAAEHLKYIRPAVMQHVHTYLHATGPKPTEH
jgi:hypothetical protein